MTSVSTPLLFTCAAAAVRGSLQLRKKKAIKTEASKKTEVMTKKNKKSLHETEVSRDLWKRMYRED